MFFRPKTIHHTKAVSRCLTMLPESFGVMCWNVHKANAPNGALAQWTDAFLAQHPTSLLAWQEAWIEGYVPSSCYVDASANLVWRAQHYGVLNASPSVSTETEAFLSHHSEAYVATHKSFLMTRYRLCCDRSLRLFNVHAINFRENGAFAREMHRLGALLRSDRSVLIVAGDFNTWNRKRLMKLYTTMRSLGLRRVPFRTGDGVKYFRGAMLDHIFYRGLHLESYRVLDDKSISDHHPLWATFRYQSTCKTL